MKQKKIFILAAAALAFAACSSDESPTAPEEQQETGAAYTQGAVPVTFGAYVNRATTRAGAVGDIATASALNSANFGVFGYYTDNNDYDQFSVPNFMYNEKIYISGSSWTYSPIKYWPNEYGDNAVSEDYDRVTFFAYAPYVEVTPTTGKLTTGDATSGIVGLSRNSAAGDPLVKYIASFDPNKAVDLLWGVVGSSETSWSTKETTSTQTLVEGFPWLDVKHAAAVDQKVKFTFDHALAKLNVQVDAFVDGDDNSNALAADNKIFIRSITFTGLATKGALNLNNTDGTAHGAKWYSFSGLTDLETGEEVTIYDGRKDGKEGTAPASTEKVLGLNDDLIEDGVWSDVNVAGKGVTETPKNLFKSTAASPIATDAIYVIPTGEKVNVTIVYEVEAADAKLPSFLADGATHGNKVKNTITQTDVFTGKLENGKSYTLKLHLGMNSVKFDAVTTTWTNETPVDVDLPEN